MQLSELHNVAQFAWSWVGKMYGICFDLSNLVKLDECDKIR